MKDAQGLYYFPQPGDTQWRVYVRRGVDGEVEFRLWQANRPDVWEHHPWMNMADVRQAAHMYLQERTDRLDPRQWYDLAVARLLLREDGA